jgi:putative protease
MTGKIELLAPAGSVEALNAAVGSGADAVYIGLKKFNARLRSANFTYAEFERALRSLRRSGRKLYVAVNTVFEQREADRMYQTLKYLAKSDCDGIIVQDFGVVKMARSCFPSLKIHSSTQMNVASSRAANMLSKEGVTRVVLARELSFEEIKKIRENTNIELEIFVHGSLCVSASGLCLFSSYLGGKSANRGMCTQACRRIFSTGGSGSGYYFSPRDLQLLEKIPLIAEAGINAVKIEGRMKSADYVGCVVSAYRAMLDSLENAAYHSSDPDENMAKILLKNDFARPKTIFNFDGRAGDGWLNPLQDGGTGVKLGHISKVIIKDSTVYALIDGGAAANPGGFAAAEAGDSVRLHRADDSERAAKKIKYIKYEADGSFWIDIPDGFSAGDNVYLINKKEISRYYQQVLQKDAEEKHSRGPGFEKAPLIKFQTVKKSEQKNFPEGIYAAVSRIEDMYIVQAVKPSAIILSASIKNIMRLMNKKNLPPFKPKDIILSLPPFFTEDNAALYEDALPKLAAFGYSRYVINNLAHISLLKNIDAALICGPYLYTFNRFAVSFLTECQLHFFVTPLENNRQNLERVFMPEERGGVFVSVFAYPRLFQIYGDLSDGSGSGIYDFHEFADNRGEQFLLIHEEDSSSVIPQKSFSIVDKIPFLKHSGFKRFIVDFSGPALRKQDYKNVMRAVDGAAPLNGATRFNWKNGFFDSEKPRLPRIDAT